ncbi:hypothetical protein [Tatumella saanichensis]|uniref:hypothetical protein n=1 Tax=Tatumella saanichensis TaxID=480813 RepID=UPI0004B8AF97|nr:hypothetical protein [Tatumella saanichensis]
MSNRTTGLRQPASTYQRLQLADDTSSLAGRFGEMPGETAAIAMSLWRCAACSQMTNLNALLKL